MTLYKRIQAEYEQTSQRIRVADVCGYIGELYADRLTDPTQATRYFQQAYSLYENPYEQSRMLQSMDTYSSVRGNIRRHYVRFSRPCERCPSSLSSRTREPIS